MNSFSLTRADLTRAASYEEFLKELDLLDLPALWKHITEEEVVKAIHGKMDPVQRMFHLLAPAAQIHLETMAVKAQELTIQYFGRQILIYAPLYLSNWCESPCLYCGFSANNKVHRSRLSMDDVRREAEYLKEMGIRHLLLLTGCSRVKSSPEYIAESAEILREYFPSLGIEVYTMTEEEYKLLYASGIDELTLYQETYDRKLYAHYHPSGPKSHYSERINAPERAAQAGFHSVNFGVLLGLAPWRVDLFKAAIHGLYIQTKYPSVDVALSYPRIRPHAGSFQTDIHVSDKDLVQAMVAWRIMMPYGGISLSTRETRQMRDNLFALGVTKASAGSSTAVGGYGEEEHQSEQFAIDDNRTIPEVMQAISSAGLQPVLKSWQSLGGLK